MLYQQRTLEFETAEQREPAHVGEATSRPPPELIRPDRQLTYGAAPHWEWPKPDEDRDRITVDRIHADIDGPSHRFVIERGDQVEVFLGQGQFELGTVTGISHRNQEVRVSHRKGSNGLWYGKGGIYPAPENAADGKRHAKPLSVIITSANVESPNGFTETDRVQLPGESPPDGSQQLGDAHCDLITSDSEHSAQVGVPYTFDDFKKFRKEFPGGNLPFADYRAQFQRLQASQEPLLAELKSRFKAPELVVLAGRMGSFNAKRSTKDQNAAAIVRRMLSSFVLDGIVSYAMGEQYEDAVAKKVLSVSLEDYAAAFAERQAADLNREKALTNPKSFFEFRTFLQEKSEADLTDEQLARYDALHADITRERRAAATKTTVQQFQHQELAGHEFQLREGFHDKRQCALWIVQLSSRVERAAFNELNIKAKQLGGWYSSFKKTDAGFQFLQRDQADRFCGLLAGDANRSDVLEARKERKEQTAAERLHELAKELAKRADETIEQSEAAFQNTQRRSDIQAGVRGRAYSDQALSRTIHSVAEALSRGEAKYLDGIRHKTHVETLETILYLAKWARVRALKQQQRESTFQHGRRIDHAEDQPIGDGDIRFATFPYPSTYKRHLEDLVARCRMERGAKQAAEKMGKRLARENDEYVTFSQDYDIGALTDFLDRARGVGADVERIDSALEKYKRLQRANITDIHELRTALREYLMHRAEARGDDPVKVAERELIGKKMPGFFPTPGPVIERMLELARIEPHHSVLEPSCGKGDLIDAIKRHHPDASIHAIEVNRTLADVLSAKGHEVAFDDFLNHRGNYDRILMNPPFESGADVVHIQHAFQQLSPGGRLISVVSEGPFFRVDNRSVAFRDWLEEVSAEVERLPEDAFQGADAFRETGVRTRLITINKED